MIEIKSYGSSSAGNAYVISDGERSLMLEAGIHLKNMNDVDWQSIDGCLVTHEHGDHSKYAMNVINQTGIDLFLSAGTQEALKLPSYRTNTLKALNQQNIGNWTVLPFDVQHDVNEPLGFFIQSKDGDKLLFATDTYYIKYKLPGITHLMIECNYSIDILNKNVETGRIGNFLRKRIVRSHFELENVKHFIRSNDMSQLQEVWLLHLSSSNADAARFKKEIQAITGVPVYIA
ncbi:MBL fold metallo-hydrolase [Carnobacterium antarcticum]|uniref:MBL fold metallo-hydrolase n=1 Tax=Carnobacterium antarcticum TaxID=2126436 RepID=A0ABW4NNL4_9LACT|nr:MBL fold metallo-hydrolase [Carnobacterium sp. CP1]